MQRPYDNGQIQDALRRAIEKPPQQNIPMLMDAHGNVIGVLSVTMAMNKPVMATFEEMFRRVIREELVRMGLEAVADDSIES